ncbi:electron transfer flavoprotein beta subunit [Desulfacinum hydrothermale DSM 13146]|uniref:Electron transfer flavoprotein beta subunit n=1 Tax=Desulfacinum hydrothermale DSM 13146 TaxID=1121390 RepID=A0A1W1X324_9BACT|nr:electron transfer flavoprotein subunit beta/FixA family protein [Desulfacinum hydrothermale]SMC18295.1 electron transfer flavoprotein beta subunit [Desulfacinum hydrothermale DSM 13146]
MRIVCLAKLVPDVDNFQYDHERSALIRENVRLLLNPADATAVAIALKLKADSRAGSVHTVTLGPRSAMPHLEDLLRRGVDRATLISDPAYAGSDTHVTSHILAAFLSRCGFDVIFAGTHTLDGGTGHVGPQVAEILGIPHMAGISHMDPESLSEGRAQVRVESEEASYTFALQLPAVLGFAYAPEPKLPFIRYEALKRDLSGRVEVIDNQALGLAPEQVGVLGSLTRVRKIHVKGFRSPNTRFVRPDDEGIERVYRFLREKGFVR